MSGPSTSLHVVARTPRAGVLSAVTARFRLKQDDLIQATQIAGVLRRLAVRMAQRETALRWDELPWTEQERLTANFCRLLAAYYPEMETELRHLMGVEDQE